MSQNDFTIANQGFPAFRADLNSALQALASNSSGVTAPSTTFANMWWYDSANNIMYIRNEDNDAWIKFAELDQTNDKFVLSGTLQLDDGTVSAPALTFNSDTNMGIYRGGTDILKFVTAGTDRLTILANGDVGIGTSSPASDAGLSKILQLGSSSDTSATFVLKDDDGDFEIGSAGGSLRIYDDGLERMRITSAGNVGIGTSSPDTNLDVESAGDCTISITANSTSHDSKIDFVHGSTVDGGITFDHNGAYASEQMVFRAGNNTSHVYLSGNGHLGVGQSTGARFGELLTVKNSGSSAGVAHFFFNGSEDRSNIVIEHDRASGGTTATQINFHNSSSSSVGKINSNGSSTSYVTSSDHRLKENVTSDWDATTRLKQLNPVRFNFIIDADTTVDGFLAHEVQSVVPEAISGTHNEVEVWKDGEELPDGVSVGDNKLDEDGNTIPVYQGIDQSKLVPLLVKTIQELEARITALETA